MGWFSRNFLNITAKKRISIISFIRNKNVLLDYAEHITQSMETLVHSSV